MNEGGKAVRQNPDMTREFQVFWDGRVTIDVAAADYVVATELGSDVQVLGIEIANSGGGNVVTFDHKDEVASGGTRTGQTKYCVLGVVYDRMPEITKVYNVGTTAAGISLYYQRRR